MPKRIYVGNLPFSASDDEIRSLFAEAGEVSGVEVKKDRKTESAMAIVVFEGEGPNTLRDFNGRQVGGRTIIVSDDRKVVINHEEQY